MKESLAPGNGPVKIAFTMCKHMTHTCSPTSVICQSVNAFPLSLISLSDPCLHSTDFYPSFYSAFKESNVNQFCYPVSLIGTKGKNEREVESLWHVKTAVVASNNINVSHVLYAEVVHLANYVM